MLLIGIFLVAILLAVWLYPRRPAVVRPVLPSFYLILGDGQGRSNAPLPTIDVSVTPTAKPHIERVQFSVWYQAPPSALVTLQVENLSGGYQIKSCTYVSGPECGQGMGGSTAVAKVGGAAGFTVQGPGLTLRANGVIAEGELPRIVGSYIPNDNGGQSHGPTYPLKGNTQVTFTYSVPHADTYDWTPVQNVTQDTPRGAVAWTEPLQALSAPIAVTGVSGSASATDNQDILIAGALLGIAGAAVIAAVQEFVHRKD